MSERLVHDALAQHTTDFEIHRELHDVRPHLVYEVDFEGRRAVCKVATHPAGDPETEGRTIEWVDANTTIPVPEVLAVGDDHFVTAWDDGVPQHPDEVTTDEARIRALGRGLARLHTESTPAFDVTGALRGTDEGLAVDADARWSDTLLGLLDDRRRFLAEYGHADIVREVMDWVDDNRRVFDAVDDAVLVHGNWMADAVGTNRDGAAGDEAAELACVIDFEHALVGSPEWDYLRAVTPLFGGGGPDTGVTEAVFRTAYESVRSLPDGFDDRRRALRVVNGVSYLRSLYLQRADRDPLLEVARRAHRTRQHVAELLADLRNSPGRDRSRADRRG